MRLLRIESNNTMNEPTEKSSRTSLLDNRIPPPFVFLLMGALMWITAQFVPTIRVSNELRWALVGIFGFLGLLFASSGFFSFDRAKTTIDPVNIQNVTTLVTTGIYRYTRNPMYVGLATLLAAWTVYLAAPLVLLGPFTFVLYITRFQILPEERFLTKKFGDSFNEYRKQVRRWL